MKCKNCKQPLPIKANFCPHCGQDIKKQKSSILWSSLDFGADLIELILDIVTDIDIDI